MVSLFWQMFAVEPRGTIKTLLPALQEVLVSCSGRIRGSVTSVSFVRGMRAVVFDSPGGAGSLRVKVQEVPDPVPGPGEVLIRVTATALNRADIMQRQGLYPPPKGQQIAVAISEHFRRQNPLVAAIHCPSARLKSAGCALAGQ